MERLTAYYGDCEEAYLSCERCGKTGIHECWTQENCTQMAVDRLAAIEDILGDDYDLDRLKVIVNQQMTMREEVSQRFSLTEKIPLDRLKELVEAEKDGRCWTLPIKAGDEVWFEDTDGRIISEPVDFAGATAGTWSIGFEADAIGKNVFLTKEEAEIALKGDQDG